MVSFPMIIATKLFVHIFRFFFVVNACVWQSLKISTDIKDNSVSDNHVNYLVSQIVSTYIYIDLIISHLYLKNAYITEKFPFAIL